LINHDEKKFCLFSFWKKILYIWKWKKNHKNFLKLKKPFARTSSFLFPLNYLCIDKHICIHPKKIGIFVFVFSFWHFHWNWLLSVFCIQLTICIAFSLIVSFLVMILQHIYLHFSKAFFSSSVCLSLVFLYVIVWYIMFCFFLCIFVVFFRVWNKKANRKKNAMWFKIRRRMDWLVGKKKHTFNGIQFNKSP
jgi:hypothetical protein